MGGPTAVVQRPGQRDEATLTSDPASAPAETTDFSSTAIDTHLDLRTEAAYEGMAEMSEGMHDHEVHKDKAKERDYGPIQYRTVNFTVQGAPDQATAKQIGDAAEAWRRQLSIEWLGPEGELPRWATPCPIKVTIGPQLGAGGATSFVFDQGQVFGWDMKIQGTLQRVLDSVLPHEVTHTIFATHFRQPLPRWVDEGACTMVEHRSEIGKHERMLMDFLRVNPETQRSRGIGFKDMFAMTEYPEDVLPLYAQGHSLSVFLSQLSGGGVEGQRDLVEFIGKLLADRIDPSEDDPSEVVRKHYGYEHLLDLQEHWLAWVKAGRPGPSETFYAQFGPRQRVGPESGGTILAAESDGTVSPAPVTSTAPGPSSDAIASAPRVVAPGVSSTPPPVTAPPAAGPTVTTGPIRPVPGAAAATPQVAPGQPGFDPWLSSTPPVAPSINADAWETVPPRVISQPRVVYPVQPQPAHIAVDTAPWTTTNPGYVVTEPEVIGEIVSLSPYPEYGGSPRQVIYDTPEGVIYVNEPYYDGRIYTSPSIIYP